MLIESGFKKFSRKKERKAVQTREPKEERGYLKTGLEAFF